ncbi:MAG: sigma-70 family RNA polymerase sigma factor [Bacteroidales bacterium]|jgi:RNA polymerase sigma-70 factor (ECF subfamily)|nr:sigma-70 family RNA polymerase sigma factor [Bacteroidales bacterium]
MVPDQEILDGCKSGERRAFGLLYEKYASTMLGICMRYCKRREEAEDVLHEGFIKVFANVSKFRAEGSFEGWIKRIMINTSLSYYNASLKHYFQSGIEQLEDMTSNHEEESIYSNAPSRSELLGLIQDLPDGYRFVFNMYVFEDFSHKEIASMLGISVNTSKSQLAKARRRLQKKLEEDYNMKPNIRSK